MTDHDPVIRDAFEDDPAPMAPALHERLWTAVQQRQSRRTRRRYLRRTGVVLLAGAAIGGVFVVRNVVSRSSASAGAAHEPALAADSLPAISPPEPSMIQEQSQENVLSSVIPLLGHRSSLSMDIDKYEAQIDALGRRLNATTGGEHEIVVQQLEEAQHQLAATKAALAVVDRELSGQQSGVETYGSVSVTQSPPIFIPGPAVFSQDAMYVAGGLGGALLFVTLAMMVYVRRMARSTRQALAQVESQISSQHATLASGIDAIAVEVERLGEGQRFMSRVLSKGEQVRASEATT